jgi:ketosteroid isomerase-like protein
MSQENVEFTARLRRGYDAYNRGDFDAAMEWIHPEIELVPAGGQPPIRGAAAYRAWMEPAAFESQVIELLEVRFNGNKPLTTNARRSAARAAASRWSS